MRRRAAMSEELKAEYEKQLRRIKRFVRQATKRGFEFPESAVPKHPKTITEASVRRVASITPDTLYKKATYTKNTGEKLSGLEGRKHERSQAAIKAAETRAAKAGKVYQPKVANPAVTGHAKKSQPKKKYKPNTKAQKAKKKKSAKNGTDSNTDEDKAPAKKSKKKAKKGEKTPRQKHYENGDNKGTKKSAKDGEHVNREKQVLHNVLEELEQMIATWVPNPNWTPALTIYKTRDKNVAKAILESAIKQIGRKQVAMNCEESANVIIPLLEEILYGSGSTEGNFKDGRTKVNFDIVYFQQLLLNRKPTAEENVMLVDLMEQMLYEDVDEDDMQYSSTVTYHVTPTAKTGKRKYDSDPNKRKSDPTHYQNLTYSFEDEEDAEEGELESATQSGAEVYGSDNPRLFFFDDDEYEYTTNEAPEEEDN